MKPFLRDMRDILVSLRLTVLLLVLSMVLIFAATLDQVNLGIWSVQEKYFRSFVVYARFGNLAIPVFPGGYLVGGVLLANLVAAHAYRFAFTWRKAGIQVTHAGLILLLVGELLSGLWQRDHHMRLAVGETKAYAESERFNELVLVDATDANFDEVVAIPEELLASETSIQHPKLPFRLVPKVYHPNSQLQMRGAGGGGAPVTEGFSSQITVMPLPRTHRPNERNVPSAVVEIVGTGGSLGSYLVSPQMIVPQVFEHGGRTWKVALRSQRAYQPFSLTLLQFSHDRYAGTEIPKNFSSRLKLHTPDGRDDREVLVYMNNPLRYRGLTFYQAGFENNDRTTILQVVRNPSWTLPYIACGLITFGLVAQFGIHLAGFVGKRRAVAAAVPAATAPDR